MNFYSIWDILRCWAAKQGVQAEKFSEDSIARKILSRSPKFEANFMLRPDVEPKSRLNGLVRFQQNPPNWGPKAKAKGSISSISAASYVPKGSDKSDSSSDENEKIMN